MRERGRAPILWCAIAAALFGASTPASKPLLDGLSPLVLSGLLYAGAALAVAPWALRGRGLLRGVDRRNALSLAGAVFFGGIVGPVILLYGLSIAPAGSVALWLNLEAVATAVLARVFFREHLGRSTWIAVALIVLASGALSPASDGGLALLFVALACIAWGLDNNLTSIIDRFSPAQVTFAKGAGAACVNLGLGLVLSGGAPMALADVGLALLIGALSYGVSLLLYIRGAQHLGATRSQLVFSTAPAWGLALAWVVLGEPVQALQLGAAATMAFAIWLWYRERHAHPHTHGRTTHRHWHRHDDGHHDHAHGEDVPAGTWHFHEHTHEPVEHEHPHRPDLHHRHEH